MWLSLMVTQRARMPCPQSILPLLSALALAAAQSSYDFVLDGAAVAHVYDGHGGLSAGASSRLLFDYPVAQRADILDMLFEPQWGMGLHTLKVEIGGDTNSGDGSEPSHMHARDDLSCTRGYELWLMREAKARNPLIKTYGLSWGVPAWLNNGTFFGPDMIAYQIAWLSCVRSELGFNVDYIGVWNEREWGGAKYVISLRAALDAVGFKSTQIIIPDGRFDATIMATAAINEDFNASFNGIGLHYPCSQPHPNVQAGGKTYWASEDWWDQPDWIGARRGGTCSAKITSRTI